MWSYPSKVPARINPLPHKSIPSHSFLTRLIFPSPLHLSAQIVLLINYAIISIGWLIAASSSRFPLQIKSYNSGSHRFELRQVMPCEAGCQWSLCFHLILTDEAPTQSRDATDLRQAASLPTSY